jgi:hypothetical protein
MNLSGEKKIRKPAANINSGSTTRMLPAVETPLTAKKEAPEQLNQKAEHISPAISTSVSDLRDQIKESQYCLEQQNCDFNDSDPRNYEFSIYKKLEDKVMQFKDLMTQNNNPKSSDIQKLAQELMGMENGAIKELALDLMATQNPNEANIEIISKEVLSYHDSNLIEKGLNELRRYLGTSHEEGIQLAILQNLSSGSLFVREKLSEQISPFISKSYLTQYQDLIAQSPANSKVKKNLKSAVDEWTMKQQGG